MKLYYFVWLLFVPFLAVGSEKDVVNLVVCMVETTIPSERDELHSYMVGTLKNNEPFPIRGDNILNKSLKACHEHEELLSVNEKDEAGSRFAKVLMALYGYN